MFNEGGIARGPSRVAAAKGERSASAMAVAERLVDLKVVGDSDSSCEEGSMMKSRGESSKSGGGKSKGSPVRGEVKNPEICPNNQRWRADVAVAVSCATETI